MRRLTAFACLAIASLLLAAPASAAKPRARHTADNVSMPPEHRIYALNAQGGAAPLSFEQLISELGGADVVICGEYHDDPATHRMELALLAGFRQAKLQSDSLYQMSRLPGLPEPIDRGWDEPVLSLEMFERDAQAPLSSYIFSEVVPGISQKDFLAASRPWSNYAKDYRPLIEYCKTNLIPVIAANSPTSLARRVAKEGLEPVLASLSDDQRAYLALRTTAPHDAYWERFLEFMGGAGDGSHGGGMTEEQIYGYYQAQCMKDDTMAESIEDLSQIPVDLWAGKDRAFPPVFHINGSFHSDYGYGVAQRVRDRRPYWKIYTVAIRPLSDFTPVSQGGSLDPQGETLADGTPVADFVIFVPAPAEKK